MLFELVGKLDRIMAGVATRAEDPTAAEFETNVSTNLKEELNRPLGKLSHNNK